jgi:hypothetical protein
MILNIVLIGVILILGAITWLLWASLLRIFGDKMIAEEKWKIYQNLYTQTAYDGKYYPANLIFIARFEQDNQEIITDFSQYENKKIVYMFINSTLPIEPGPQECLNGRPQLIPNVTLYQPMKGVWEWK